jgi:tetratricopeptide (TPR) repeat protein
MALKLDSKLPRAHTMLAAFHLFGAWDWPRAEATSRRAIQLNPSDALARNIRAAYHVVVGEVEEAVEQLAQAHQLDPRNAEVNVWIAIFAYYARRYDLAIERCQEVFQLDPSLAITHRVLGLCYAQTGDYTRALSHCEKARELGNAALSSLTVATAVASSIYALIGERDSAERLLQQLVAAKEQQYIRYVLLATASVGLGNHEQTLGWLEKAYEQRDPLLVFLEADPRFDPLSALPRFRKLLRRIGLPS